MLRVQQSYWKSSRQSNICSILSFQTPPPSTTHQSCIKHHLFTKPVSPKLLNKMERFQPVNSTMFRQYPYRCHFHTQLDTKLVSVGHKSVIINNGKNRCFFRSCKKISKFCMIHCCQFCRPSVCPLWSSVAIITEKIKSKSEKWKNHANAYDLVTGQGDNRNHWSDTKSSGRMVTVQFWFSLCTLKDATLFPQ